MFALAVFAGLLICAACDRGQSSDVDCAFGDEHGIGTTRGSFDAVRVTSLGDAFAAIWTSPLGTFVRRMDEDGRPLGPAKRIGTGCAAGLDITPVTGGGATIACLAPPRPSADKPGALALIDIDAEGAVVERRTIGETGSGSRGVSVAALGDGRVAVAHYDGERRAVILTRVSPGEPAEPRVVSREGPTPGPPDLFVDGERLLLTWAETVTDPQNGTLVGEVLLSDLAGAPHRFASVLYEDAQPRFARDADGLVVAFRDENPAGSRVGLFTARVGANLRRFGDTSRIGRSDAASGAALFPCAGGFYAVAAHSYSRREMLVGVARLDDDLESIAGERQVYTSGARYEHGTGICANDAALLLVAERAGTPDGEAVLKGMTLRCDR